MNADAISPKRRRGWAWLLLAPAALGLAQLAVGAGEIVDPPAIDVFPVHEQIGLTYPLERAIADGRRLFEARFNVLDGAGRPHATGHGFPTTRTDAGPAFQRVAGPDANSCAGCHNQPVVGGSGDFVANVFVAAPQFGLPLVDSIGDVFSNERNTRSLFGLGGVEIAAREMTAELLAVRQAALDAARQAGRKVTRPLLSKGVSFGAITATPQGDIDDAALEGISPDLVVKPFGSKGTVTSIREFTIVALNQHHGIQPVEFFGEARTGTRDHDQDGVPDEFSIGQTTALSLFQAALPAPDNSGFERHAGYPVFRRIGCDGCHLPALRLGSNRFLEPNPYNRAGVLAPADNPHRIALPLPLAKDGQAYVINAFTDLKRHVMCDKRRRQLCNERKKQDKVPLDEFMTTRLWDLATSAPYCHRGDCSTLSEAIEAHGGEAARSADAFDALALADKRLLVSFLRSLGSHPPPL
jgi:hypothetical protein